MAPRKKIWWTKLPKLRQERQILFLRHHGVGHGVYVCAGAGARVCVFVRVFVACVTIPALTRNLRQAQQQKALRTDCNTSLPSFKHTPYITATYRLHHFSISCLCRVQRRAHCFAFLNTTYINATYLSHSCNASLPSLQHTTYPRTSLQRTSEIKTIYYLLIFKYWKRRR